MLSTFHDRVLCVCVYVLVVTLDTDFDASFAMELRSVVFAHNHVSEFVNRCAA